MNRRLSRIKKTATTLLALTGIGTMAFYTLCDTECAYLQGDILGIDLKLIGILFMAAIAVLAWTNRDNFLRATLAAGVGGEVFLLWFQLKEGVYCPYCLAFAACVVLAFAVNYETPAERGWKRLFYLLGGVRFSPTSRHYPLILFVLAGFAFLVLTFSGSTLPAYAAETVPYVYGQGEREVRVYSDYFCAPCRRAEPKIEKLTEEIARNGKGRVLFIDTPMHRETVLYAKYYIYATGTGGETLQSANQVRRVLFEAAEKGLKTERELRNFLEARKIKIVQRDTAPFFRKYNDYIKEDGVRSTPTVVIAGRAGKKHYSGEEDVIRALEETRLDGGSGAE